LKNFLDSRKKTGILTTKSKVLRANNNYKGAKMGDQQFHEEMSIIRNMIERTRRETFQSGYLFIVPGIIFLVSVIVMGVMEMTGHAQIVRLYSWIPFLIIFIVSLSIGFWEGAKAKSQPKTYARSLFVHLWGACAITIISITMVMPHMHYTSVAWMFVVGLGFYMTGVIYELRLVQASGVVWWIGAFLLGFVQGNIRLLIWSSMIFLGYVLPGIILNRQYRKQGNGHGA
jgi:hypothetical protein